MLLKMGKRTRVCTQKKIKVWLIKKDKSGELMQFVVKQ